MLDHSIVSIPFSIELPPNEISIVRIVPTHSDPYILSRKKAFESTAGLGKLVAQFPSDPSNHSKDMTEALQEAQKKQEQAFLRWTGRKIPRFCGHDDCLESIEMMRLCSGEAEIPPRFWIKNIYFSPTLLETYLGKYYVPSKYLKNEEQFNIIDLLIDDVSMWNRNPPIAINDFIDLQSSEKFRLPSAFVATLHLMHRPQAKRHKKKSDNFMIYGVLVGYFWRDWENEADDTIHPLLRQDLKLLHKDVRSQLTGPRSAVK
jgi:hypothetical protein